MANDYLEVYRELIADPKRGRTAHAATAKGTASGHDRRHQNGTNPSLYIGD
jgi:hypothetical protein